MVKRKSKKWTNYGEGVQVVDITFEVNELDRIRLSEGKDSDKYKKQHSKTVRLIEAYNREVPGGRGQFSINISRARYLIQLGAGEESLGVING